MNLDANLQRLLVSFERLVIEVLCLVHVSDIDQIGGHSWVVTAKHPLLGLQHVSIDPDCLVISTLSLAHISDVLLHVCNFEAVLAKKV